MKEHYIKEINHLSPKMNFISRMPNKGHIFFSKKECDNFMYLNCINCGLGIYYHKKSNAPYYSNEPYESNKYIWKMTCEEVIIKNILE